MFREITRTQHPPAMPTMVWDGKCGFCRFWILHWTTLTGSKVTYVPFQEAAPDFIDIPEDAFREAVRFIEPDGTVYSGPEAAYRTLSIGGHWRWMERAYQRSKAFRTFSNVGYQWVADHREFMMRLTHVAFGKNPTQLKPIWSYYLMIAAALVLLLSSLT